MSESPGAYDALLLVSFGGPETADDVLPFLQNVTLGWNVPPERLTEVAAHYDLFGGVSPINAANRALLAAIVEQLNHCGPPLPVYWGNRFWHPMLPEALGQMAAQGVHRALALATSAFGSYSGCRAYLEDIARARQLVGPTAPEVHKLRLFFNHPGFIAAQADRVCASLADLDPDVPQAGTALVFTAHSLPMAMAQSAPYVEQLEEACRLVVSELGDRWPPEARPWQLAYQSGSGTANRPWLGPDIADALRQLAREAVRQVIVVPIGFTTDHMEVVYDLDVAAAEVAESLGLTMVRAATVGCHPRYVSMIRELVLERIHPESPRLALGTLGPWPDCCPTDCCPAR